MQTNITVTRTGPNTLPSTVDYVINDGSPPRRKATSLSRLVLCYSWQARRARPFPVLISDDAYAEGPEMATLQLTGASGATVGTPSTAMLEILDNELIDGLLNPIDDPAKFCRSALPRLSQSRRNRE